MVDVSMKLSPAWILLAFICSYNRLALVEPKIWEKNDVRSYFDYVEIITTEYKWTTPNLYSIKIRIFSAEFPQGLLSTTFGKS